MQALNDHRMHSPIRVEPAVPKSAASSLRPPRQSTLARSAVALAAMAALWAGSASANSPSFKSYYYTVTVAPASDFTIYNGEAQTSWYSLADAPQWFMVVYQGGMEITTNHLIATFTADPGWVFKSVDVMASVPVALAEGLATLKFDTNVSSNSTGTTGAEAAWQNTYWYESHGVNLYLPTFAPNDTTFQLDVTAYLRLDGWVGGCGGGAGQCGVISPPVIRADVGMVYAPVPEPGTAALWMSGIGMLGLRLRRRKGHAA